MAEPCPAHKSGLVVTVTERHDRVLQCTRTAGCNLQEGHDDECE